MKAKIGWLVWEDEFDKRPLLYTTQPESWYHKIQQIVYFEVDET